VGATSHEHLLPFPRPTGAGATVWLIFAGSGLCGCGDAARLPEEEGRAGGEATELVAEHLIDAAVDLEIGLVDGDPRYLFGSVHGIAIDPAGRIFVADGRSSSIRVYDEDGTYLDSFGRRGEGPGEFSNPCCLAFDGVGRLWVWNDGDLAGQLRYEVFEMSGVRGSPAFRIPGATLGLLWPLRRILFDRDGNVVHPTFTERPVEPGGERTPRRARIHVDTTGTELRRVAVRVVPQDSLGGLPPPRTPGGITRSRSGPMVRQQLLAHAPFGGFADAVNARYEVYWYDDGGKQTRVIRRDLVGPPLTPDETAEARATLGDLRERARSRGIPPPDVAVPERHPPLERLHFDGTGRLWVQRRITSADTLELADVYDPAGAYLYTVRWPRDIILYHGAVRGGFVYGVSLDELDVARIVRLRIAEEAGAEPGGAGD
jgi:hypothetical protein